jgi:hypothetical protein
MTQPRRWFQLHLSTVVVLTLIAGVLVGLNVQVKDLDESISQNLEEHYLLFPAYSDLSTDARVRGWPMVFEVWYNYERSHRLGREWDYSPNYPNWLGLVFNIATVLAIASGVGLTLEYYIRRRSPQV